MSVSHAEIKRIGAQWKRERRANGSPKARKTRVPTPQNMQACPSDLIPTFADVNKWASQTLFADFARVEQKIVEDYVRRDAEQTEKALRSLVEQSLDQGSVVPIVFRKNRMPPQSGQDVYVVDPSKLKETLE